MRVYAIAKEVLIMHYVTHINLHELSISTADLITLAENNGDRLYTFEQMTEAIGDARRQEREEKNNV